MVSDESTGNASREFGHDDLFDGYRIDRVLGRGGMGIVYQATQLSLNRQVALKVIAQKFSCDPKYCARFQREAHLAAAFEHPAVLPIYDYGQGAGALLYMSLKLVRGVDLRKRLLDGGPMTPSEALRVLGPVAEALDGAHKVGLIHRDVKPANVLLEQTDGDSRVYLADFGIAKRVEAEIGETTAAGELLGTPQYMAPEQISGDPVDGQADIYAFGCLLYECLVGEAPFSRATSQATLLAHIQDTPPRPSAAKGGLPEVFDLIILRALEKDPARRAQSAVRLVRRAADELSTGPLAVSLREREDVQPHVSPTRAPPARDLPVSEAEPPASEADSGSHTVIRRRVRAPHDDPASRDTSKSKGGNAGLAIAVGTVAVLCVIAAAVYSLVEFGGDSDSSVDSDMLPQATATAIAANTTRTLVQRMAAASSADDLTTQLPALDRSLSEARRLERATRRMLPEGGPVRRELVLAQRSLAQTGRRLRAVAEAPGAAGGADAVGGAREAYGLMFDRLGATIRLIEQTLSRAGRLHPSDKRTLVKVARDLPSAKRKAKASFAAISRLVTRLGGG